VTYDLGDVTLLPGLIDAHTHLGGGEELTPFRGSPADRCALCRRGRRQRAQDPARRIHDGARSRQSRLRRRGRARCHRRRTHRRAAHARRGQSLSATGGHGDENELPFDIKVDRYFRHRGRPDEIRRKVRQNIKYGADWIKLLATGGVTSANTTRRWPTTPRTRSVRRSMRRARSVAT
jgi:imidazolonepropionase-like amidohydrolase